MLPRWQREFRGIAVPGRYTVRERIGTASQACGAGSESGKLGLEIEEGAGGEARQDRQKHGGDPFDRAPAFPIRLNVAHDTVP